MGDTVTTKDIVRKVSKTAYDKLEPVEQQQVCIIALRLIARQKFLGVEPMTMRDALEVASAAYIWCAAYKPGRMTNVHICTLAKTPTDPQP